MSTVCVCESMCMCMYVCAVYVCLCVRPVGSMCMCVYVCAIWELWGIGCRDFGVCGFRGLVV